MTTLASISFQFHMLMVSFTADLLFISLALLVSTQRSVIRIRFHVVAIHEMEIRNIQSSKFNIHSIERIIIISTNFSCVKAK